jgi:hypothetical protein
MFCKSLNGKFQININYRVINKLIIMLIIVGLFAAETTAVDCPLTTRTKVDYDAEDVHSRPVQPDIVEVHFTRTAGYCHVAPGTQSDCNFVNVG